MELVLCWQNVHYKHRHFVHLHFCFTLSASRKSVDLHFEHLALDTLI